MKNYKKPVALMNDEMMEGVYAASGKDCYTVNAHIHQTPEEGRGDFRFQVDGKHAAGNGHHSGAQVLVITFNQSVEYVSSSGSPINRVGNQLAIKYNYHNNANDNIGLGDVCVKADPGIAINSITLWCNLDCGQHTW